MVFILKLEDSWARVGAFIFISIMHVFQMDTDGFFTVYIFMEILQSSEPLWKAKWNDVCSIVKGLTKVRGSPLSLANTEVKVKSEHYYIVDPLFWVTVVME